MTHNLTTVYYDSQCGLCGRAVRMLKALDRHGRLMFEPLSTASDTVLVKTPSGALLQRTRAVRCALAATGGIGRVLAILLGAVPTSLADRCYRYIARNRACTRP